MSVRTAYFAARAQKALAEVARDNLKNQASHRAQIIGFVEVGIRSHIDQAQAETDYANAEVQSINADDNYQIAKVQLNQAMGLESGTEYDVSDEWMPEVEGEDLPIDALYRQALLGRADLVSLEQQIRAQQLTVGATKGAFGPTLGATVSLTDSGTEIGALAWNWNATANASWTLFDGLLVYSQLKEAKATLSGLVAQRDALRQQLLVDVSQARLQVRTAKTTLSAAERAEVSARLQLSLAEGRYQEGVGSVIELGDAQVAYVSASAQRVQALYTLSTARAQLLRASGKS